MRDITFKNQYKCEISTRKEGTYFKSPLKNVNDDVLVMLPLCIFSPCSPSSPLPPALPSLVGKNAIKIWQEVLLIKMQASQEIKTAFSPWNTRIWNKKILVIDSCKKQTKFVQWPVNNFLMEKKKMRCSYYFTAAS